MQLNQLDKGVINRNEKMRGKNEYQQNMNNNKLFYL
jgi:hypothetical protein